MSLPVILRRQAQVEFDDAADWYEQRRLGRGVAFTVAGFDTKFAEMRRWLRRAGAYLLQSTVFLNFVSKPTVAVKKVLTGISSNPEFYPEVYNYVREAVVSGYPYAVYYRVTAGQVWVLAIFHAARDPSVWQERSSP